MRTYLAKSFLFLFARLPLPLLHGIGFLIGKAVWFSSSRLKQISIRNISLCFPQLSPQEQQRLCRNSLIEMAKTATELGFLWFRPKHKILKLVRKISGEDELHKATAEGKGIIFVSPHMGAWELMGLYCSTLGEMTSLYKPPKLSGLEARARYSRQRYGARLVPTDASGVRKLYQALNQQQNIGILPDQDPSDKGVFAPFFGIQTNTMILLPRLAAKSKAPVLYCIAQRLSWGRGYHVHFIRCPESIYSKDLTVAATQLNRSVEQCISLCPEQYQWSYKRFKTRPQGEAKLY